MRLISCTLYISEVNLDNTAQISEINLVNTVLCYTFYEDGLVTISSLQYRPLTIFTVYETYFVHKIITPTYHSSKIPLMNTTLLCNVIDMNPMQKHYSTRLISTSLQKSTVFTRATSEMSYLLLKQHYEITLIHL